MDFSDKVTRLPDETEDTYCQRLYLLKDVLGLTWMDLADIINEEFGYSYSPDRYRKNYTRHYQNQMPDTIEGLSEEEFSELQEMKIERMKIADERSQVNALYHRMAREETIKEIAHDVASQISNKIILNPTKSIKKTGNKEAVLLISDWHYGINIDNIFNKFNPDIARERINLLQDETIRRCKEKNITDITVINLGDLIAGNIHTQLRINSQFDVITQIIEVSEIYAELLANLSEHFNVTTYSVLDNHSRIDPNKETSLHLESLARITPWYLKERLRDCNVTVLDNTVDDNIATFNVMGYNILGVHGDLDKQSKLVERLTTFTQAHYDLIVSAHMHHFSADESNNTLVVCNGSLMGTDEYAFKLRLNSDPSQTLIIVSEKSVCEEIHRIVLK